LVLPLDLLRAPEGSCLLRACLDVENLTVYLATTAPTAACPLCGHDTPRVHSRYTRRLDDLPCLGQCVRLQVAVRRFACPQPECPRRIFTERLPGFAAPWARTTDRLRQTETDIGSSLGGEAGARLAVRMAITTSPDTLLRRVKRGKNEPAEPPRVVGIDDWAWRKGQRYGTIVVDLERSDVVDLLPDRDADTVAAWLKAHPGIEVVSRDRSATYAQAATEGAPRAVQVADRWHLLKNLREAVERVLGRHSTVVNATLKPLGAPPCPARGPTDPQTGAASPSAELPSPPPPAEPVPESPPLQAKRAKRRELVERFDRVHELHKRGYPAARIARELGLSRRSVFRYLRRETCPAWDLRGSRRSRLDRHRGWIDARLAEGLINVADWHRQLTEGGFKGSYGSVYAFVTKRLGATGKKRERLNAAVPPIPRPPSARQLSFEWARRPEKRKPPEQARLDAIRACSDELAAALDLADRFADLVRKRSSTTLGEWLARGEASSDPDPRCFAEGIRRDEACAQAAVTERWSNGPVEGHVNRLKTIKRQMYGRAGFVLLRARVLNAA
jgi:transposase/predicted transcriptional regulator